MVKEQERKVELPGIEPRASFAISEVFEHNGIMIQRSIIRPGLNGLQTKIIGVPTIGLPAVIPLKIFNDHNNNYVHCV